MEDKIETLIMNMFENYTDAEIAQKIGKSRAYVANYRIRAGIYNSIIRIMFFFFSRLQDGLFCSIKS